MHIPIFAFPENLRVTASFGGVLVQTWDARHIAEIFYLQYFYVVVYSDGRSANSL